MNNSLLRAASVVERIKQWTSDPIGALRADSIPGTGDFFFFFFMMMMERRVERKARASTCWNEHSECRRQYRFDFSNIRCFQLIKFPRINRINQLTYLELNELMTQPRYTIKVRSTLRGFLIFCLYKSKFFQDIQQSMKLMKDNAHNSRQNSTTCVPR